MDRAAHQDTPTTDDCTDSLPAGGAPSVPVPGVGRSSSTATLDLPGTWNARDVAGAGAPAGGHLRPGVLLRSASLSALEPEGAATLEQLGLSAVLDLRGDHEIERDGRDRLPEGPRQVHLPFGDPATVIGADGSASVPSPAATTPDPREMLARLVGSADPAAAGADFMRRLYAGFATDPAALAAVAGALETIASEPGAVLVHCAAGKDRTGWVVAVVQLLCEVPWDEVLAEYLLSASSATTLAVALPDVPGVAPAFWTAVTTVVPEYLETALEAVRTTYGSLDGYVSAAGVTPAVLAALRRRLVAPVAGAV